MTVYGVDFTSAPSRRKPITIARGTLAGDRLHLAAIERITTLAEFEAELTTIGAWWMGIDAPFGLPREFRAAQGWPEDWSATVARVAATGFDEYEALVARHVASAPPGRKHPLRLADEAARSHSPVKLHHQPVGRMFYRVAPILLRAPVSVLPCRPAEAPGGIVVEAYPALVAGALGSRSGYKAGRPDAVKPEMRARRASLVAALMDPRGMRALYGIEVAVGREEVMLAIEDRTGDHLDALFCAVQAAWASRQTPGRLGVGCPAIEPEGWIADPSLADPSLGDRAAVASGAAAVARPRAPSGAGRRIRA